jgi:hypothetical protein
MIEDELRHLMPDLTERDADGFVALARLIESKGSTLESFLDAIQEAETRGLSGRAVFYYAGEKLRRPGRRISARGVKECELLGSLHGESGIDEVVKMIGLGLSLADDGTGATLVRLARRHKLDPLVWSEIAREVDAEGLADDAAREAALQKFMERADRASWPRVDEEE